MEVEDIKTEKLEHLVAFIASLSNSQKILTQTALDFQSLGVAKKHHIEEVIDQAEDLGEILEFLIKLLKEITEDFFNLTKGRCEDSHFS